MRIKWLFLFFIAVPAQAYNLTQDFMQGFYWAGLPITVKVIDTDEERKKTLEQLAEDAVGEWEARTGLSLWSFDSGSSNIVRWSNNFAEETKMDPLSVLAVAIRYTSGPYFARSEIVINGSHPLNHELHHLLTTITHELGHTMGLDHSADLDAVMAPTLQDPYRGLHSDDVQGMHTAFTQTQQRQLTKYVSPLAYERQESKRPLSCATVGAASAAGRGGAASLVLGMLIAFIGNIFRRLKLTAHTLKVRVKSECPSLFK